MALSLQRAKELIGPTKEELENLEARIDDIILIKVRQGCSSFTLSASFFQTSEHYKAIKTKYNDAGWTCKFYSDQRDGDFYTFTSNNT